MFKILNPGDGRTCSRCRQWVGRTVSDADGTLSEWRDLSGALHPNCRCSLIPLNELGRVNAEAQDYMTRKTQRIRELVKFKIAYHDSPTTEDVVIL